jgi:methionine biosynthesis protein MetW
MSDGARVLDLGCGAGNLLSRLPPKSIGVGIDLSREAIRLARASGHEVAIASLEGAVLPFRDESFDIVTCLGVIEHVFDPRPLLGEASRVLRRRGLVVMLTPNVRYLYHLYRLLIRGRGPKTSGDPEGIDGGHLHYFTFADAADLLREAGFESVAIHGTGGVKLLASIRSPDVLAVGRKAP